jgi:hypothetical protein
MIMLIEFESLKIYKTEKKAKWLVKIELKKIKSNLKNT